jgi:hypothetical protein
MNECYICRVKKPLKDEKEGKMGEHSIPIGN